MLSTMIDWSKIYKEYKGFWVAMKDDEKTIIGKGKTAKEAIYEAEQNGYKNPIITFIPANLTKFAGYEISI